MDTPLEIDQNKVTNEDRHSSWGEIIRFAIITLIIVIPIRAYIAQPFIVSGASMVPTFHNGEYLIIDELSYRFQSPERGEVVVFRYPENPSKFFIKRIIGLPGETVTITDQAITITKDQVTETLNESYALTSTPYHPVKVELKADEYFMMGDNRDVSSDSRIWGPVKYDLIKGQVFVRLLPITKIAFRPGDFSQNPPLTNNQ